MPQNTQPPKPARQKSRRRYSGRTEYVTRSIPKTIAPVIVPIIDEILRRWRAAQDTDERFDDVNRQIASELLEAVLTKHEDSLKSLECLSSSKK